ncbi:MAG: hypothetical protein LBE76_08340, partial [Nitrososphaerota archaeon]|nr:hypothetical protein [Nitrososphaerota archaeon]
DLPACLCLTIVSRSRNDKGSIHFTTPQQYTINYKKLSCYSKIIVIWILMTNRRKFVWVYY